MVRYLSQSYKARSNTANALEISSALVRERERERLAKVQERTVTIK